jgi:putative membrane protein
VNEAAEPAPEQWRRTSPLGFLVRAIVGLRNLVLPALAIAYGSREWEGAGIMLAPVIVAMVGVSLFFSYLGWRHFRYRLGESDIRVERGILSRSARSVPYERIQDVSLEQALVPRLFGMVEVRFETGAGGKDELRIAYVTEAEGAALRESVRALKIEEAAAGEADADAAPVEVPTRVLFAMNTRRLATFGLFEFSLVVFAVLAGAAQQFDFLLPFDIWNHQTWIRLLAGPGHWLETLGFAVQVIGAIFGLAALAIVGLVTGVVRTVLRDYGFRLEETPKGLRRRRGLLTRTDVVMPLHRVQALKVTTGIVRRRFGWHALEVVSLAQDAKSASHVVVPFARMSEIEPVIRVAGFDLPDAGTRWHRPSPRYRVDRALLGSVPLILGAAALAALSRWLPADAGIGPLVGAAAMAAVGALFAVRERFLWRYERHAIDRRRLYARRGWLAPKLDIASRVKLHSVEVAQGPIARRRGYAEVRFGVAGGTFELRGIPLELAHGIREEVLESVAMVDFSALPR